jgi:ATP phosphoribosyltransferase regulatory subunit HisZ
VEATFDQLEKDLESAIDKQNQALGLHLPENLDTLQKGIIEIGSKLREMNGDLRTDRSLSTLITFNHETRANLEKYQNDIFK